MLISTARSWSSRRKIGTTARRSTKPCGGTERVRSVVPTPYRPPHHHVHAADRGPGAGLEFARGILDGGDEALRISAFPAFIKIVHEIRLVRLSTSNIAFLAIGLFGKRSWRGAGPFHQGH